MFVNYWRYALFITTYFVILDHWVLETLCKNRPQRVSESFRLHFTKKSFGMAFIIRFWTVYRRPSMESVRCSSLLKLSSQFCDGSLLLCRDTAENTSKAPQNLKIESWWWKNIFKSNDGIYYLDKQNHMNYDHWLWVDQFARIKFSHT